MKKKFKKNNSNFSSYNKNKFFLNSSWIVLEQLVRILFVLIVTIYIARFLGPSDFGILSYVITISSFVVIVGRLGMDSISIREFSIKKKDHEKLLGTVFWTMFFGGLFAYLIIMFIIWSALDSNELKIYCSILSCSVFFTSFLCIEYFFQSHIKAKISSITKILSLSIVFLYKIYLIIINANLSAFIIAYLLDSVIISIFLLSIYLNIQNINFFKYFNLIIARKIIKSATPLFLSAIATIIFTRIDQIMIQSMLSMKEVGIYSIAVRIFESWILLPVIISTSILPIIVKYQLKNKILYHKFLTKIMSYLVWSCILFSIITYFFGKSVIIIVFGFEYLNSAAVLNILVWASIFSSMGSISTRYFIVEKIENKIFIRTFMGAIINIILNFILIKKFGINGAAISTLISLIIINYFLDLFDKDLKQLFVIKNEAIFKGIFLK